MKIIYRIEDSTGYVRDLNLDQIPGNYRMILDTLQNYVDTHYIGPGKPPTIVKWRLQ